MFKKELGVNNTGEAYYKSHIFLTLSYVKKYTGSKM